ncbi:hypothetical protein U8607_10125 [Methylobacterium durans]|uniref:hypothetical protein n=1 Tax=Methylobacterium durans TaxID=2202825 RepID=UPI002AFEB6E5|nr:hypothetical protein [Methylobacterium durans]MEA1832442.1 hypothetical protein [Methylobacterium durans]
MAASAQSARLTMDDKASLWPKASMQEKIDFTNRMGKAFVALSPELDNRFFMRCLEETANIGDTKDLRLEEMVRACVAIGTKTP